MHATLQSGGRSPKPMNGPASMSQLKSDNVQTATSVPSQAKGRKRERADQGSEPIKRERSLKADDCDSAQFRSESILKFEISRITEKGGLVDSEGVEKLVQYMQPNKVEKKLESVSRSMFAGVIAATENFDCLSRFVQLKGLPVLDQWLQDVHKGRAGDGSPKDVDKSVEEFLFILLRALDKLPVNLQALQMCNIGKSVNHLRTYKNSELQKKARSLVDTWKKRVEAEMNVDTKSGSNQAVSWSSRRLPEGSHGGNRQHGGTSEAAIKSPSQFSSPKIASSKPVQAEMNTKLATSSPGPDKVVLAPASVKDVQPRSVVGSNPERSSSSSPSHNNSQSCSSEHTKTPGVSGKEDARSSTAGSISVNKVSVGSSRPRRSVNGNPGSAPSGSPRETGSSRISTLHKSFASEKLSKSGLTCEKVPDLPTVEGSNNKLIVKIPHRGRSPSQSASVGPIEDPTVMNSRASSPVFSEKNDQSDPDSKERGDEKTASDVKTESWQSNDFKDILTGSDEGDRSPDAKLVETSKVVSHSLGTELQSRKLDDASFSSINALIESCVKYSQANATMSGGDDGGMNLLASVAAGEISKSNFPSPNGSSGRTSNNQVESGLGDDSKSEDCLRGTEKQGNPICVLHEQATAEGTHNSLKLDPETVVNLGPQINDRSDDTKNIASISSSPGKVLIGDASKQLDEKAETKIKDEELTGKVISMDDKVDDVASRKEVKKETFVGAPSNASLDADGEKKAYISEACTGDSYTEQKPFLEAKANARQGGSGPSVVFSSKVVNELDDIKLEDKRTCDDVDEYKESESSATNAATETSRVNKKPKFDLNEGFNADDGRSGYPINFEDTGFPVSAHVVNHLPSPLAFISRGLPTSVTVAAAAKGPFVPPIDLLRSKRELGWKGSAATSAFRPAEPRKAVEMPPVVATASNAGVSKPSRPVLDFDLNVADERMVDDVACQNSVHETASTSAYATKKTLVFPPLPFSVGLDLDLNQVDEAGDTSHGSGRGLEVPLFPAKSSLLSGYPVSEPKRDFDLNDGPFVDEPVESSLHNHHGRSNTQSQSFSSWYSAGNAFPPVSIPSILSDRGDQPFPVVAANGPPRILGPPIPFTPELYRGSVLSSSPAVPFPSFQYPVFPFGTGFPLPSASLSGVSNTYTDSLSNGRHGFAASNSQLLSAPLPRPYVVTLPDGSNSMSIGNSSKWVRQGLDLNAGPGAVEMEPRDETSTLVSRQLSVASSQALADEQGRMFQQMAGGSLKRKENAENFRYKQPSWP